MNPLEVERSCASRESGVQVRGTCALGRGLRHRRSPPVPARPRNLPRDAQLPDPRVPIVPKTLGVASAEIPQRGRCFGTAAPGCETPYRDKGSLSLIRAFEKQIRDLGCCYERCLLRSVVYEKALSEHTLPERTALTDRFATSLRPNRLFVGRYEDLYRLAANIKAGGSANICEGALGRRPRFSARKTQYARSRPQCPRASIWTAPGTPPAL